MLDSILLLKKKNLASPEARWGASDMYPSNTSAALPLSSLPSGGSASGVSFVTNAPGPISNAAYFSSGSSNIQFTNTAYQLAGYTDFCVEWWWIINGNVILASLWHPNIASGCAWSAGGSLTNFSMSYNASNTMANYVQSGLFSTNTWAHCAISRQSSTVRMFLNGALMSTSSNSSGFYTGDLPFYLGYRNEASGFSGGGYLAGFRLTRGQARYVQPFTPSTVFQ